MITIHQENELEILQTNILNLFKETSENYTISLSKAGVKNLQDFFIIDCENIHKPYFTEELIPGKPLVLDNFYFYNQEHLLQLTKNILLVGISKALFPFCDNFTNLLKQVKIGRIPYQFIPSVFEFHSDGRDLLALFQPKINDELEFKDEIKELFFNDESLDSSLVQYYLLKDKNQIEEVYQEKASEKKIGKISFPSL